jgi:predicted CxxxxCH...CXXCH cytochrome family protein
VTKTGIPDGCEYCHQAWTAHPTPWLPGRIGTPNDVANATSHATAGNLAVACALCHGALLNGVGGVAPSCMSNAVGGIGCHATASPALNPTGCISCHAASPGGPNGLAAPNRGYGHNKHASGLGLVCSVCHGAATYGMASHANGTADMIFSGTYRANSGITITYNSAAKTCSGVSCHGGQTTPDWRVSGSISVATDCLKCHEAGTGAGTPQYNSYYGRHAYHLTGAGNDFYKLNHGNVSIACTDCHNTGALATKHFVGLDTPTLDPPGDTIGGVSTQVSSYNKTLKTCTTACHFGGEDAWQ